MQDVAENTYESIGQPNMQAIHHQKKQKKHHGMKKYKVSMKRNVALDEDVSKAAAAMFEDITKKSCNFLASTATTCTAIRLQKIVTSSKSNGVSSPVPKFILPTTLSMFPSESQEQLPLRTREETESINVVKMNLSQKDTCQDKTNGELLHKDVINGNELVNGNLSSQVDCILMDGVDNRTGSNMSHEDVSNPDDILQNKLFAEKEKNKERMRRLEEVRKAKDDENSILPINPVDAELAAEKIRNKERMRKREKAKEDQRIRVPSEMSTRNVYDSDESRSHVDSGTEGQSNGSSGHRRKSKLSRKEEVRRRRRSRDKDTSSTYSSPSDVSTMSADDDDRLMSSGAAENLRPPNDDSQEKNMFELSQNNVGMYQFPYSIGHNLDRVSPLRPHFPYSNPIYGPAPIHPHNNLIFNHPTPQNPYGNYYMHDSPQVLAPTNTLNNNPETNHAERTLPKLNNLALRENADVNLCNNIVLPSGRGKPRESERVIQNDIENLEKIQEEARARLKAFLERAESEGLLNPIPLDESVT